MRRLRDTRLRIQNERGVHGDTMAFGFDSFRGLPEHWRRAPNGTHNPVHIERQFLNQGAFNRGGRPPYNDSRVEWVPGWFNESLAPFLRRHRGAASFVHVDSDLYSSAKTILTMLWQDRRLPPGAVLVFDELLINFPEFMDGEMRALCEFLAASGRKVRTLGTSASVALANGDTVLRKIQEQRGGWETPHGGRYRQDAAFVLE